MSLSIPLSTEQVCSKHTIFLYKFLYVLSIYIIKGFFVMDTLTLILPNAINTLNCHLYICISPGILEGLKNRGAYIQRDLSSDVFFSYK